MKTKFLLLLSLVVIIFSIQSCKKKGCTNSSAINYDTEAKEDGGSCQILGCIDPASSNYNPYANIDDGSCIIDDRNDFTGSWTCEENSSQLGTSSYSVTISKSASDSTAILIANFYNLGSSNKATAIVNGNTFVINPQLVDNLNVAGSGTLSGTQINLSYTVSAGGTDNVTAVYSK